jgi:hypothetical protein
VLESLKELLEAMWKRRTPECRQSQRIHLLQEARWQRLKVFLVSLRLRMVVGLHKLLTRDMALVGLTILNTLCLRLSCFHHQRQRTCSRRGFGLQQ